MKKIIILFLVLATMTSCDRTTYLDIYVKNSANEQLYVIINRQYDDGGTYEYYIPCNTEALIAQSALIHRRRKSEIPFLISYMEITKDSVPIKIDALDTNYWNFEVVSEDNVFKGSYFRAKATLVICDEYFE